MKEDLDKKTWQRAGDLRRRFVSESDLRRDYWGETADLEAYDRTLGRRIDAKWGYVLSELSQRGWRPQGGAIVDMGCGTGLAVRAWLRDLRARQVGMSDVRIVLFDRSPKATSFARSAIVREVGPGVSIQEIHEGRRLRAIAANVVLASHVGNEWDEETRGIFFSLGRRADQVVVVEPGNRSGAEFVAVARRVLRKKLQIVGPCLSQGPCGLAESDWCHQRVRADTEVNHDAYWNQYEARLGVEAGHFNVSYLALDRCEMPRLPRDADPIEIGPERRGRQLYCGIDGKLELVDIVKGNKRRSCVCADAPRGSGLPQPT